MTVLLWIGAGLVVVTMVGVLAGKFIALGERPTPEYEPTTYYERDEDRLHQRFVECLTVAVDALACYEGQCRDAVLLAEDEFDRKAFARKERRVADAVKMVLEVRDHEPGKVVA